MLSRSHLKQIVLRVKFERNFSMKPRLAHSHILLVLKIIKKINLECTQVCGSQGFASTHAPKILKNNNWCQRYATLSANAFTAIVIFLVDLIDLMTVANIIIH